MTVLSFCGQRPYGFCPFLFWERKGYEVAILNFIVDDLNGFIRGWFGIAPLLGTGVIMTVLTKFFQITHGGHWLKKTIGSVFDKKVSGHTKDHASVSQLQALCYLQDGLGGIFKYTFTLEAAVGGAVGITIQPAIKS